MGEQSPYSLIGGTTMSVTAFNRKRRELAEAKKKPVKKAPKKKGDK